MSASEAQINRWEQRLLSCGFAKLTPWQRDIMQQWLQEASWIAFFPVGGGVGFSYLLPALEAPTGVTLVICGDAQRRTRREQQAQALGGQVLLPQADHELPPAHSGVVLMTTKEAEQRADQLPAWVTGRVRRVVFDGCGASAQAPSWWPAVQGLPFGFYPTEHKAEAWWANLLDIPHETLHYNHEAFEISWDLGEGSVVQKLGHALEAGARVLWMFGGQLFRHALEQTTGIHIQETPRYPAYSDPSEPSDANHREPSTTPYGDEAVSTQQNSDTSQVSSTPKTSSQSGQATVYLFPPDPTSLRHAPSPQRIFVGCLPSRLRDLGSLANLQPEQISILLPQETPNHHTPEQDDLLRYLEEKAQAHPDKPLYLNSHEIMQALKLPLSPQISYERSLNTLEDLLNQLQTKGSLGSWFPVFFQAKILNARGFQPAQMGQHPDLLAFHEAIAQMQKQLSPLESLNASFLSGRALDLRFIAKRTPYTVRELNAIFQKLHEQGFVVNQLEHLPGPQHSLEHEYQIQLGEITRPSLAVQLWSRTKEARLPLLLSSFSRQPLPEDTALQAVWNLDPQQNDFWEKALFLLDNAKKEQRLFVLGGRILQKLDRAPNDAGLALWMGLIATLQLPPLEDASLYRRLLPPPRQAPIGLFALCKHLLSQAPMPPRSWIDYVLALPSAEDDEEMSHLFVRHNAQRALGISRLHGRFRWLLQRYHQSMTQLTRSFLSQDPLPSEEANDQLSKETEESDIDEQPLVPAQTEEPTHDPDPPSPILVPQLRSMDVQRLATSFPIETLAAWGWTLHLLGESEAGLPLLRFAQQQEERYKQRYAKLALLVPKQLYREKSGWLRWLIEESEDRQDEKLRKRIMKLLIDRKEGTTSDLQQVALWAEQEGDHKRAARLHKQLIELRPEAPEHPAALARLSLQHNRLQDALQYAIQANRLNPRHYPLDVFLDKAQEALFADLDELRRLLVDLPAHPALSKIESELSQREQLAHQLAPLRKQAEEDLKQQRLAQAREKAREVLAQHAHLAPIRFLQIRREVDQEESKLQKALQDLDRRGRGPKDPRDRNKQLEALADQAAQLGFVQLATEGYEHLTQRNEGYGLAWFKLARTTPHSEQRDRAYAKAISLARGPEQRQRNLEEWAQILDREGKLDLLLPTLLSILEEHNEEAQQLEPILLQLIGKYGVKSDVAQKLEGFLKHHRSDLDLKRAEQALNEIEHLDPWKRQLLSMQAEIAQKNNARTTRRPPSRR
ncbi:hypothetical protein L6R29_13480 [Myxococcota bacterium]|nr:hypothetical protein [Myxococcota bacterium]